MLKFGLFFYEPTQLNVEPKIVPLKTVHAIVNIVDCLAQVSINQQYENSSESNLEVFYKFPIYENAAITKFSAKFDDRTVEGVIKGSQEAESDYQQAVSHGQQAAILTQTKAEIFEAKIGNLKAGGIVQISISYSSEIQNDDQAEKLRFVLPTTIAPRYGVPEPSGSASATYSANSGHTFTVDVFCKMSGKISEVSSPSHPQIIVATAPEQWTVLDECGVELDSKAVGGDERQVCSAVNLKEPAFLDKDFVLLISSDGFHKPKTLYEFNPATSTYAVMLTMVPQFKLREVPCELIFLVDRSGSMDGFKMDQTRQALKLFLKSLPENSYFNIIGFGYGFSTLFPVSAKYSQDSMNTALQHIETIRADMGGTEIYGPLEFIFKQAAKDGYARRIFVLTDGEVENTEKVVALVGSSVKSSERVFSIGIGNAVSHQLIEGLSRRGNGSSQFILEGERMEKKIILLLKTAIQPSLHNFTINWSGKPLKAKEVEKEPVLKSVFSFFDDSAKDAHLADVKPNEPKFYQQAPQKVSDILAGKRFLVFSLFKKEEHVPSVVTINASAPEGPISLDVPINKSAPVKGDIVHKLAARRLIQDLSNEEDFRASFGAPSTDFLDVSADSLKHEMKRLGLQFELMSRYTSFVAVDNSEKGKVYGAPVKVVVPSRPAVNEGTLRPASMPFGQSGGGPPAIMSFGGAQTRSMANTPNFGAATLVQQSYTPSQQAPFSGLVAAPLVQQPCVPSQPLMFGANYSSAAPMTSGPLQTFAPSFMPPCPAPPPAEEESGDMDVDDAPNAALPPCPAPLASAPAPMFQTMAAESPKNEQSNTPHDKMHRLINLQAFSGYFPATAALEKEIGIKDVLAKLAAAPKLTGSLSQPDLENVWGTILAMLYLSEKLSDLKEEWELVYEKALSWLQKTLDQRDADVLNAYAKSQI